MNNEVVNLPRIKEMILTFVKTRGPSLPVNIAQYVKTSPLFASAFLSELYREQKLLMSDLKVGSTSLYLIPGQEQMLENFTQYLNQKELEAFNLIKKEKILEDDKLSPAIRVAMREIKDFALSFKRKKDNEEKLYWKYSFMPENEVESFFNPVKSEVIEEKAPPVHQVQQLQKTVEPLHLEIKAQEKEERIEEEKVEKPKKPKMKKPEKKVEVSLSLDIQPLIQESDFLKEIKSWLNEKEFAIVKVMEDNKKDCLLQINLNTLLGKQDYLLIAKDKKRLKHEELVEALQKAHSLKMPALVLAKGEVEKKSIPFLQEWRNLIKFEKLKI